MEWAARPPSGRPERCPLRTWALRAGQLALTALVTWFILARVGLGMDELRALDAGAWTLRVVPLAASVLVLASGYVVSGALWGRVVRDLGGPELPVRAAVPLYMVANLGRYVPGKLWQIAGLAALARGRGVPVGTATAAAVIGQGAALLGAGALGTLALLGAPPPYPTWGWAALALLAAGLALASFPGVYAGVLGAWFRLARAPAPPLATRAQGLRWLLGYGVNWVVYAAAFWLLTVSLGLEGPPLAVGSAFAGAYVLGYLMLFAPAGLGPREGFLIAFLTPHFGAGPAGVVALLARIWTTVVEVVPAGVFWLTGAGRRSHDA